MYRIYRELELNLRIKPRKRLMRERPKPFGCRHGDQSGWINDQLTDGRGTRLLNAVLRPSIYKPGNSQQNAYVERYNRTVRYDWLAQNLFDSLEDVQLGATAWLWAYTNERPNMALGGITPRQKLTHQSFTNSTAAYC